MTSRGPSISPTGSCDRAGREPKERPLVLSATGEEWVPTQTKKGICIYVASPTTLALHHPLAGVLVVTRKVNPLGTESRRDATLTPPRREARERRRHYSLLLTCTLCRCGPTHRTSPKAAPGSASQLGVQNVAVLEPRSSRSASRSSAKAKMSCHNAGAAVALPKGQAWGFNTEYQYSELAFLDIDEPGTSSTSLSKWAFPCGLFGLVSWQQKSLSVLVQFQHFGQLGGACPACTVYRTACWRMRFCNSLAALLLDLLEFQFAMLEVVQQVLAAAWRSCV